MTADNRIQSTFEAQIDPLALSEIVFSLRLQVETGTGLKVTTGRDWQWFSKVRGQLRGTPTSPYFNPDYVDQQTLIDNGFWMVVEKEGKVVWLDAYVLVDVTGDFRKWLIGWLMSHHILANDSKSIITAQPRKVQSGADFLSGQLAYRGEVWMASDIKNKPPQLPSTLSLLSMALAWQEWKPNAIWGLTTRNNFRTGKMARVGHSSADHNYITWKKRPYCVDSENETLVYSTRSQIVGQLWDALQNS